MTIGSGSILAPGGDASGDTLGVLTLNGANTSGALLTLQSGAVLEMQLGAGLASDKINLYGYAGQSDLVRNDNVIRLSGTGVTEGTYNLLNTFDAAGDAVATGFSSGFTLELSSALAKDFTASLDYSTLGQVNLNVVAVPEPTAAVVLGAVAGGLLIQRRRRA